MAIVGIMSTSVVAADIDVTPGDGQDAGVISSFTATDSFNPSKGESASLTFTLDQSADVLLYVIDKNYNILHQALNYSTVSPATHIYTWNGISGGQAVADGTYYAKIYTKVAGATIGVLEGVEEIVVTSSDTPVVGDGPQITNLEAVPSSFDPAENEDTEISFDVSEGANVTVNIKDGSTVVRTFSAYDGTDWFTTSEDHSISWNGKNNIGNYLSVGTYTVYVEATNDDGTNSATTTVNVVDEGPASSGVIKDFKLDPKNTWDPADEELEIDFELTDEVKSLTVDAKKGNKVIEILDDEYADDEDYEEEWDGTDEDGDYVDEGTWEIIVRADGDKISRTIEVKYEKPEITEAFVTKESFDPSEDEFTNLVFKVDATAVVTVDVYQGSKKEFTLVDEQDVKKNRYYAVEWDGMDEDGDEVDEGKNWKFKITAESPTDNDVYDYTTVEVDVEEDDVSDKKANVTNDYTAPIVLDEDNDDEMEITFCLDEDAEVTVEIYDGFSTGGSEEAQLLDDVEHDKGCYTYSWDGTDDKGKSLHDDVYTYKIISAVGSHKDTEVGHFVIGNAGDINGGGGSTPSPDPDPDFEGECANYYWDLGYMANNNELCEAIAWVTEEGIFQGYADGSFKPYQNINRVEVTKVILEAFNVDLFPMDGSTLGFSDVEPFGWYMPYVRTAKFYGMLTGDANGSTLRPGDYVNRVELLKIALQASEAFTGYEFATGYYYPGSYADADAGTWFYDYANAAYQYELYAPYVAGGQEYLLPSNYVERGEVALLLFRMSEAGLL